MLMLIHLLYRRDNTSHRHPQFLLPSDDDIAIQTTKRLRNNHTMMSTRLTLSIARGDTRRALPLILSKRCEAKVGRRNLCQQWSGGSFAKQHQVREATNRFPPRFGRRKMSSNEGGPSTGGKKSSSSSSFLWQAATLVVVGGIFVAVGNYLNGPSFREGFDGEEDNDMGPSPPQAEITSRAYFDVAIGSRPAGRIVIGLYGNVVPKTVKNFETLCQGTEQIGTLRLSYANSSFHRIIPGFMVQGETSLVQEIC